MYHFDSPQTYAGYFFHKIFQIIAERYCMKLQLVYNVHALTIFVSQRREHHMIVQNCKDEWLANAKFQTEEGENWILSYHLQAFSADDGSENFGLRIDKSTPEGVLCEREETLAITDSREEIVIMANAFARGSVPPVTLLEMADDWQTEIEYSLEVF
jgi:hypothetical protein